MRQVNLLCQIIGRVAFAACQMALVSPAIAAPTDPSGTWLSEDGRARVRIERCGTKFEQVCGYIVWMKEPFDAGGQPHKDQYNPDITKRNRLLLGHQLIMGLKYGTSGRFEGQIYNAENGKSYDISLWRDAVNLKIEGCMMALFCATQTWTQTMDALPRQLVGMTGDLNGPRPDKEWKLTVLTKSPIAAKTGK